MSSVNLNTVALITSLSLLIDVPLRTPSVATYYLGWFETLITPFDPVPKGMLEFKHVPRIKRTTVLVGA